MKENRAVLYIVVPLLMVLGLHITQGPGWFMNIIEDKKTYRGLASVDLMEAFQIEEGGLRELDFTKNRAYKIPSLYMYPNYSLDDVLTVSTNPKSICIDCEGGIQAGEVVAFYSPKDDKKVAFGRVVAFAGDEIEIKNKDLIINGKIEELKPLRNGNSLVNNKRYDYYKSNLKGIVYVIVREPSKKEEKTYQLQKVPKGHLFIICDNRDHSIDSRQLGPIPINKIIGVEIGMSNQTRVEKTLTRLRPRE